ncbi:MAG: two pore domain potassium channel family protein [Deltaproteobacteria bacterium]|nr:MAG: two pore domain potassium channel family protein [Deltaproteobacteria bacterium]
MAHPKPGVTRSCVDAVMGASTVVHLLYFSFSTMMTVTFGDVRPTNLTAGDLCMSETLVGQLYLAIMIARMVGLRIAQATLPERS